MLRYLLVCSASLRFADGLDRNPDSACWAQIVSSVVDSDEEGRK